MMYVAAKKNYYGQLGFILDIMFWFPFLYSLIPNNLNIHVSFLKANEDTQNIWTSDRLTILTI